MKSLKEEIIQPIFLDVLADGSSASVVTWKKVHFYQRRRDAEEWMSHSTWPDGSCVWWDWCRAVHVTCRKALNNTQTSQHVYLCHKHAHSFTYTLTPSARPSSTRLVHCARQIFTIMSGMSLNLFIYLEHIHKNIRRHI